MTKSVIVCFLCIFLTSCYNDAENYLYPTSNCDSVKGLFSSEVKPLIESKCINCHTGTSAGAGIALDNYTLIKPNAQKILNSISHMSNVSPMPKGEPKMSVCEIEKIRKWVDSGLPNN